MTSIERIQSLVEIRKPRVSEFFKDYDRLKHGIVTAEQFFRAFSNANIKFTEEEQEYIQKRYGMHNVNGDFIDYKAALSEILGRKFNPDMAAQYGSLSGVTFESTAKMSSFDQKTYAVLKKLRAGQKSRPVIGKNFFLDYDTQGDGIINANQFGRGLSCMYEAFFREYPSEEEIALMVREFAVARLEQVQRECMEDKELSQSFRMQRDEVDYRAFCAAIGASGDAELAEVEHPKTDDPAYKEFVRFPVYEAGERAFQKLLESHRRFRFDFKSFLQARDKRKIGIISLSLFVKALCDSINDLKRVGVEEIEVEEVGRYFATSFGYVKDSTGKPTAEIDPDETFVDYRKFLQALFEGLQGGAWAGNTNDNILTSAPPLNSSRGPGASLSASSALASPKSGALGHSQASGALGQISENTGHPIVDYVRNYIISRPVAFKAEFQEFDKRQSGKITSNQFMKVISKFIPVFEPGSGPTEETPKKSEPYYRGGVYQGGRQERYAGPYGVSGLYGSSGSRNRLLGQPGLTPQQLKTLAQLYAVDTTSGVGTLDLYTPTPEKLSGGGFYIDYMQFCNDVKSEVTEFVKSAPREPHEAASGRITLPAAWTVYFKIAESLNLRHLKLSDCLNEAAPGDARWNRTVAGRIGARSVQRSLSSLLGVQLSDAELAAVCLGCADKSSGGSSALLLPGAEARDDGSVMLPAAISAAVLAEKLDSASISAGKLVQLVASCYDHWQPHRYTAYSYKSDRDLRQEVVNKAESENEKQGQDVTHTAVKWLPDEAPQHLEHMLKTLGGDQIIYIKGEKYSLEELVRFAYENPVDVVNDRLRATGTLNDSKTALATSKISATFKETQQQAELVKRASRALLQLYYELHILRAQPILSFQEFDRPRAGYVTRDCFARAFVLAGLKRAIDFYPHSFQALTDLYTERGAGRFQNLVDYNLMLRELSQPPEQQLTIDQQEMERRTKLLRKQKDDYFTVSKEADEAGCQQVFDATVEGVLTILRPLCLKYRPRLRERFLDFDRRRSGVCEASKLGAALGVIQADLNKDQMRALTQGFAARGPAFQGCFDWRRFVEALETVCGCRL